MLSEKAKIHDETAICEELAEMVFMLVCSCRLIIDIGGVLWGRYISTYVVFRDTDILAFHIMQGESPAKKHEIQVNSSTVFLPEREIKLLESCGNYILWHCVDGVYKERGVLGNRIKDLSNRFLSVRNSHCINLDYVKSYRWHEIELVGVDMPIIIPKSKYNGVKEFMEKWKTLENTVSLDAGTCE